MAMTGANSEGRLRPERQTPLIPVEGERRARRAWRGSGWHRDGREGTEGLREAVADQRAKRAVHLNYLKAMNYQRAEGSAR